MKKVYFATTNLGKVKFLTDNLANYGIEVIPVIPVLAELPEPRSDDLREIAREKVLFAYQQIKKPCIAQDSGFYIQSLNGFPKAFVNFALQTIGIEGILKLVEGKQRECEFRNCLAYLDDSLSGPVYFESSVKGRLAEKPSGEMKDYAWSELFTVFIPDGYSKTLAEMCAEEYKRWREEREKNSFATKFAKWFSKR